MTRPLRRFRLRRPGAGGLPGAGRRARVVAVALAALLAVPVMSGSGAYFTDERSASASASTATLAPVTVSAVNAGGVANSLAWSDAAMQPWATANEVASGDVSYTVQREAAGKPAQTIGTVSGAVRTFTDPGARPFGMVSAGADFTVGVTAEGAVQAWGNGNGGRLGGGGALVTDGSRDSSAPAPVVASWGSGVHIAQLSSGYSHTLALDSTGKVWAWGTGALGDEGQTAATSTPVAVAFPANSSNTVTIAQVSAGHGYSLAVDSQGHVWSWGEEVSMLGYSATQESGRTPHLVPMFEEQGVKVTQVSAGNSAAFAVTSEGKVWAWGWNGASGELGDGGAINYAMLPKSVGAAQFGDRKITQISAGFGFSLAVDSGGKVFAWGRDGSGELGDGRSGQDEDVSSPVPTLVTALADKGVFIAQVSAGETHSLAVDTNGNVWSWGKGQEGALGHGEALLTAQPPRVVDGVQKGTQVSAGYGYSVAVTSDGVVWTWGSGWNGRLGNGKNDLQYSPVPVNRAFTQVSAGDAHSLGLASDGSVWAWGSGANGRLGNGDTADSAVPVRVTPSWGENVKITQVSAGRSHSLAVDENGNLWAWGSDSSGELGDGRWSDRDEPVTVLTFWKNVNPGVAFTQVSAGGGYSLAIDRNGEVWHWGHDLSGKTNLPTRGISVPYGQLVTQISAGDDFSLALTATGTVYSWGEGQYGQIGNGSNWDRLGSEAAEISRYGSGGVLPTITQVSARGAHAMAVDSNGDVWEWGSLSVSDGVYKSIGNVPVPVTSGSWGTVTSVSAGATHSLALTSDGKVWAWGYDDVNQLNWSEPIGYMPYPLPVTQVAGISHISAGGRYSLGLSKDGSIAAWGYGQDGQLGNGDRQTPLDAVSVKRPAQLFANCATPATLTDGYCTGDVTYSVLYSYLGWTSPPATAQVDR